MLILTAMTLGGLLLLVFGGELLVRGAVAVAERLGMSKLLCGLTIVGFATSTPELVTSVYASMQGAPGIAIGNFVGSNISNILLVLGLSAVLYPVAVESSALKRDGFLVLLTAIAFAVTSFLLPYDRLLGAVFVTTLLAYIGYAIYQEMGVGGREHTSAFEKAEAYKTLRENALANGDLEAAAAAQQEIDQEIAGTQTNMIAITSNFALAIIGLLIIVAGGHFLVQGASGIARSSGVSEEVIGLTVVALGTSAPEFVTSLVAAFRGYSAVALGNIMGSNIYNTLGIGGVTALIAPTSIPPQIIYYDNMIMVAASLAFILFALTEFRIRRWEGLILVFGYVVYLISLLPAHHRDWAVNAVMGSMN